VLKVFETIIQISFQVFMCWSMLLALCKWLCRGHCRQKMWKQSVLLTSVPTPVTILQCFWTYL
jgi:hypothetical protein